MKKATLSVIGILAVLVTLSFTSSNFDDERTVKITSEKPLQFDMVQNGVITKGLKTPYEFKFAGDEGYFIFKSRKGQEELTVSVKSKHGRLMGKWEIVVLTIENDEMRTFGMN